MSDSSSIPDIKEVGTLAASLMNKHCLLDWTFSFDSAPSRSGCCYFDRKQITLSKKLVGKWTQGEIKDTLLHEIAHALAGPDAGHGPVWKAKAKEIGCSASVYHHHTFTDPKYVVACSCGKTRRGRYRLSKKINWTRMCRYCNGPNLVYPYKQT